MELEHILKHTAIALAIALLVIGGVYLTRPAEDAEQAAINAAETAAGHDHSTHVHPEPITDTPTKKIILDEQDWDHTINSHHPVRVVVYSDTDCPFCDRLMGAWDQVRASSYGSEISLTYRHGRLPIYPKSKDEGLRLECVGRHVKDANIYNTFKRELLQVNSSNDYRPEVLDEMATKYMTAEEFETCQNDQTVKDHLDFVFEQSHSIGVRKLPHTFIYTADSEIIELVGSQSAERLKSLIDEAKNSVYVETADSDSE